MSTLFFTGLILFLVLLVLTSGTLSASETAFFSLSSMKVRGYKSSSDPRWQTVAKLVSKPRKLLVTILMLNVLVNILVQNVVSSLFGNLSGWLLTVIFPLLLVLIFGEVIPKTVAIVTNEKIAYRVAPLLSFTERVLRPVRDFIVRVTNPISRFFFFFLQKEKDISLEELKHALRTSKSYGVLEEDEANLVRGFLNLEDFVAKEVMCPRQEIIYYDITDSVSSLIHHFTERECSRIPVCEGSLENIRGVITSKTFFLNRHTVHTPQDVLPLLDKPIFIPETMPARDALRLFYEHQQGLLLVVDEYSSICGLVTLEDLVEVVVGQIEDKRDEEKSYTVVGKDVLIASGKMELAELEEIFDVKLSSHNNMVTLGGWLIEQEGDIPKTGQKFVHEDFLFHILAAEPNRVQRIYVRRLHSKSQRHVRKKNEK